MGELWELSWPQSLTEDHQQRSSTEEVIEFEVSANDFSNSGTSLPSPGLAVSCMACTEASPKSTSNGFGRAKYLLVF